MAWVWRRVGSLLPFRYFHVVCQGRMDEVELGRHTIKSHGAALAKNHMHDWLILLLLALLEVMLYIIHPFYRFVGKDMMTDLKYPMKRNTVPIWAVPVYAVLLPISVFLLVYVRRRDVYDLHHGILGVLYSVLITGVITDSIKNATGRPRPDFFWRCFPDGIEVYDKLGNVVCHGKELVIREGYKSFPSGHASWSFAGLGFLSLYLCGKIRWTTIGTTGKMFLRAGFMGLIVAAFCYHQFFPPPYDDEGWGPYAYFRALEEMHTNSNSAPPPNGISVRAMEAQATNLQARTYGNPVLSPEAREERSPFDDVECGRR
ncbi:hypothetical protein NL676_037890 [Syzygium grande]|nr:hypothetical protein NL676_037890 [Syzygium grande]